MSKTDPFFMTHTPLQKQIVYWGNMELEISNYLTDDLPTKHLVSSVRCILFYQDQIMVIQNPNGDHHILPGGRCEPGETLEETGRREVLEETGWQMGPLQIVGTRRFRHNTPKPPGYPYPYPDFLQLVMMGEGTSFDRTQKQYDKYVVSAEMEDVTAVQKLTLSQGQKLFLERALQMRNRV